MRATSPAAFFNQVFWLSFLRTALLHLPYAPPMLTSHPLFCTCTGRFEDPVGCVLPSATQPFLDTWKRSDELVYGQAQLPMYLMKGAQTVW